MLSSGLPGVSREVCPGWTSRNPWAAERTGHVLAVRAEGEEHTALGCCLQAGRSQDHVCVCLCVCVCVSELKNVCW